MSRDDDLRRRSGINLVEVLVAIVLLGGLIAVLVLPAVTGVEFKVVARTRMHIAVVESGLTNYATIHDGAFPSNAEGLKVLLTAEKINGKTYGPYLEKPEYIADEWDNPLQYQVNGPHNKEKKPDIFSNGPDRLPNTADDITNWRTTTPQLTTDN